MTVLSSTHDEAIRGRLDHDLIEVRRRFAEELVSDLDCVNQLAEYVEQYHGKMLRPMLVLMTAMAVKPDAVRTDPRLLTAAAVVEMVHMATLVHDDVLDDAQMRRRGRTINLLKGNEAAVMLGDYLISHAYHLCSSLDQPAISRIVASATNTVCEGELLQLARRHDLSLDEPTYNTIITRKTASLTGACCRIAAVLSGCDPADADALYDYGETLGIAFQIIDDVLDLAGDPATVGKSLGRDLAKGKLTLPLIRAIQVSRGTERARLCDLITRQADPALSEPDALVGAERVRQYLNATDAMDYTRRSATARIEQAKSTLLSHLPDSPARASLMQLADSVISRRL